MVLLKSVQKTKEGLIGLCEDGETVKLNPADRCGSLKSDKGGNFMASLLKELENDGSAEYRLLVAIYGYLFIYYEPSYDSWESCSQDYLQRFSPWRPGFQLWSPAFRGERR